MKKLAAPALPVTGVPAKATFFGFFSETRLRAGVSLNVRRSIGSGGRRETPGLSLRRGLYRRLDLLRGGVGGSC